MKIIDIALKDLLRSFRSLFAIGMMVGAPLALTGLIYLAFGGLSSGGQDMPSIQLGLVNLDRSPQNDLALGQTIREMFYDESVSGWIVASDYPDEQAVRQALADEKIGVAVVIPAGFTEALFTEAADVPIWVGYDPALSIGPQVVRNMITGVLDAVAGSGVAIRVILERQQAAGSAPDPAVIPAIVEKYQAWYVDFQRALFHSPERAALKMVAPGESATGGADPIARVMGLTMVGQMIFFAFFTGAYAMMSILREQEEGTLARLFTTPTERTAILTGKFLAVFLTVILQGIFLMIFARLAFRVDWGQPGSMILALVGQVIAASGLGVLLIAFVKNTNQGGPVLGVGLTLLGMLGGLMTVAIPNMPAIFNQISRFTPQGWVLETWKLTLAGQSPANLLTYLGVITLMGVVMFAIGAAQFRRRLA